MFLYICNILYVEEKTKLKLSASPLRTTTFPVGPIILSKGIYSLRALSTYYHTFPLS